MYHISSGHGKEPFGLIVDLHGFWVYGCYPPVIMESRTPLKGSVRVLGGLLGEIEGLLSYPQIEAWESMITR